MKPNTQDTRMKKIVFIILGIIGITIAMQYDTPPFWAHTEKYATVVCIYRHQALTVLWEKHCWEPIAKNDL